VPFVQIMWQNVAKYCKVGQATDDNMAHAHCMLDTRGYKHTLTLCNTYCFSTVTMVSRKHHSVTSHELNNVCLVDLKIIPHITFSSCIVDFQLPMQITKSTRHNGNYTYQRHEH
jgi:hypothetical protein